jgi:hypothetical protein
MKIKWGDLMLAKEEQIKNLVSAYREKTLKDKNSQKFYLNIFLPGYSVLATSLLMSPICDVWLRIRTPVDDSVTPEECGGLNIAFGNP